MINIVLLIFCLINSYVADGIRDIFLKDEIYGETATTINFAGAILRPINSGSANFYGVSGTVSVYNPQVTNEQMSVAAILVRNGSPKNYNSIIIGWHVVPRLYNDYKTHLFVYWRSNIRDGGCTNLQCEGFVQIDKSIVLGQSFNETSNIDGTTVELTLAILQEPQTKDWWVYINEKGIGYYPASLFDNMASVDELAWMGKTTNPTNTPSPPMGYGVLPGGDLTHSCFFKKLAFVNDLRKQEMLKDGMGQVQTTNPHCYGALYDVEKFGLTLQFGGPGGNNCSV